MVNKKLFLILSLALSLFFQLSKGQDSIAINEFMAINDDIIKDEDGDNSDWIEIYNSSSTEISLSGWYLTDDENNLTKWSFPNITISAKEYLIVFASNKDRKAEKGKLHTNFKLSGSGEYLALVKQGNQLVSVFSPVFPEQFQNISYGKISSGYTYLSEPSPGIENIGSIFILPPKFSVNHGFYDNAFNLDISSQTEGADIYYTTNAATPDKTTGIKYTSPLNITTTIVVRAIAIKDGVGESATVTQSYIFPKDVVNQSNDQPGYPSIWTTPVHYTDSTYDTIPANYGMKQEFVSLPEVNKVMIQSLKSLPVVSIVTDIDNLFSWEIDSLKGGIYMYNGEPNGPTKNMIYHIGRGWTRPASVEYFNSGTSDGSIDFQANCAIKIHGGATRTRAKTEKHSLKLGFKSEFGPSKLEQQMFGEGSPNQYDWLVLRGGFAPRLGQQVRDPWAKSTVRDMGQYAAYSKFVHVYINGLYWGMYNLSERMDENCMRDNLGGKAGDYDILKDYLEVETGDTVAWYKLAAMAADPENYQEIIGNYPDGTPNPSIEKLLDPDNLIDYIMMNMYAGTTDWDYHNWIAARRKTDSDGFHFITWDAEGVFQGSNVSSIVAGGEINHPTGIFSDLLANEQFKNLFISHVNKHFFEGGELTPNPCLERYEKWLGEIDTALICDQARWVYNSGDIWNSAYHEFIYTYFPPRTEIVFKQFISENLYPTILAPTFSTTKSTVPEGTVIKLTSKSGGEIRYTLDGTDPGHFKLTDSKSISIYDSLGIHLDNAGDTITIYARVKNDTLWSRLVKRTYIVIDTNTTNSSIEMISANDGFFYSYPNPVDDFTQIAFSLSEPSNMRIKVYNMMGVELSTIYDEYSDAGEHTVTWEASGLAPGVYFCVLENLSKSKSNRITVIKR